MSPRKRIHPFRLACLAGTLLLGFADRDCAAKEPEGLRQFIRLECADCHDADSKEGGLDLTALTWTPDEPGNLHRWGKVHDMLASGQMPPKGLPRPDEAELQGVITTLDQALLAADRKRQRENGRAPVRRLTRGEYEYTVGDLLAIEGAPLKPLLPEDGIAHDTSKHADALDVSYVQLRQYMAAADRAMDYAIVTFPMPPQVNTQREYPQRHYRMGELRRGISHLILLEDKTRDPRIPIADKPLPKGPINELDLRDEGSANRSVGLLGNHNRIWKFGGSLAGHYRIRGSFWGYTYNRGKIEPTDSPRMAALLVQDQRGENVLSYADAPSKKSTVTEVVAWMNPQDRVGWTPALFHPVARDFRGIEKNAEAYNGAGVAVDWIEIEGPLHEQWPPQSHRRLFGDLPLKPLSPKSRKRPPKRDRFHGGRFFYPAIPEVQAPDDRSKTIDLHRAERHDAHGPFTPTTDSPLKDAERLLADFLPRAFRRPVPDTEVAKYVATVERSLSDGDCFELAMRTAYQTALCSYSFLYRGEQPGPLPDHAVAARLSYFLWNSMPDDQLFALAEAGKLRDPAVLNEQVDRMLDDPKSDRFIADFLDQWLNLDEINATTPDEKLYPEFQPFMADMMLTESREYFRELIEQNRPVWEIVDSDWAMLNQGVAELYGIEGVAGVTCRRVNLPDESPRGGMMTQASVLKVTADGTSTSPVRRGVFILEKILGQPPAPPPPDIGSIDPDVRGATTVREVLAKHRDHASCASCHANIDPPGFTLESFDPIGQYRTRYRGTEVGDDPEITFPNMREAQWRLGPPVDSTGETADGMTFHDLQTFRAALKLGGHEEHLARNLMERILTYATGAEVQYADRPAVQKFMQDWKRQGYGLGDLIHLVVQSEQFLHK